MAETYLYLFIGICIAIVAWGLIRLERVYKYPFFMVTIFLSFILPQAISLVNNSFGSVVSQAALQRVLLYSCMCIGMCWIGYQYKPNSKWLAKLDIPIDQHKLFIAGTLLTGIGYLCNLLLSRITIQTAANGNWTGVATILDFFAGLIYIGLPIFLLQALSRPNLINIALTIISTLPILQNIIVSGRRQATMTFLITIGLSLFIIKRYVPPRWVFITGIILAAYIIPVLGQLRGSFWTLVFNGDWQTVVSSSQQSLNTVSLGKTLELRNAALIMDASEQLNKYGYGTGFWDSIVFQFVPGQIVGFDVKKSLQFNLGTVGYLQTLYGYSIPNGSTPTGIGDSFMEFGYFGCVIYALIGFLFKNLWISTIYRGSVVSSILYIGLISPAMLGITHGIGRFCQEFIFQCGALFLVTYFSRQKKVNLTYLNNKENYL